MKKEITKKNEAFDKPYMKKDKNGTLKLFFDELKIRGLVLDIYYKGIYIHKIPLEGIIDEEFDGLWIYEGD